MYFYIYLINIHSTQIYIYILCKKKKKTLILDAINPLTIQRTAGGTPSGERVKLSDTQKKSNKKKKKVDHVIYPRKAEILVISTM